MDIFVLLATMLVCFLDRNADRLFAALAAIVGAIQLGIPLEAVMLKISDGVSKVAMLTIRSSCWPARSWPRAVWRDGWWRSPTCWSATPGCAVAVDRQHRGDDVHERHLGIRGRRHLSDRLRHDPADGEKSGYPRVFATNLTITASVQALLGLPSHNAVLYSLATGGTISISALFMAGVFPGLLLGFSLIILCLVIRLFATGIRGAKSCQSATPSKSRSRRPGA